MQLTDLKIEYPELPVVEHREEFFELLEKHQVIIVKADTGSGKSTQLPKFLLEWFLSQQNNAVILEGQGPENAIIQNWRHGAEALGSNLDCGPLA